MSEWTGRPKNQHRKKEETTPVVEKKQRAVNVRRLIKPERLLGGLSGLRDIKRIIRPERC